MRAVKSKSNLNLIQVSVASGWLYSYGDWARFTTQLSFRSLLVFSYPSEHQNLLFSSLVDALGSVLSGFGTILSFLGDFANVISLNWFGEMPFLLGTLPSIIFYDEMCPMYLATPEHSLGPSLGGLLFSRSAHPSSHLTFFMSASDQI